MNWHILGGKTCQYLVNFIQSPGLVFSIISDDRIPEEVISFLQFKRFNKEKINIHILGDLFDLPLQQWRVRNNFLPWLDKQYIAANVLWYDGDLIREINHLSPIHFDSTKLTYLELSNTNSHINSPCEHYELKKISEIIGKYPHYEMDSNGKITNLSFMNNGFNDMGILNQLSRKKIKEVLYLISQIPSLKTLNISFSKNLEITELPKNLVKLDCRGSLNIKFETELPKNLTYLNISACNLKKFPKIILNNEQIKTLLLYKNYLSEINDSLLPSKIERLSIYRNNIAHINLNIDNLPHLAQLNIGANPLTELNFISNSSDRELALNMRKINTAKLVYSIPQNLNLKIMN